MEEYLTANEGIEILPEDNLEVYSKFWGYAKEHFQFEARSSIEYLTRIKESVKFFHLDIPVHLNEVFVKFEESPLFWIYESPLVQYLEEMLKIHFGKANDYENYKALKEFYTKWIVIKSENEKRYFANSALGLLEKSSSKYNFFFLILKGILFTFEKSLGNSAKAFDIFSRCLELVQTTNVNEKYLEELVYTIHLFTGFAHLKQKNLELAKVEFTEAMKVRSFGVTAKFYLALVEVLVGNHDSAATLLNELYQYDLERLAYAIDKHSVGMFKYFLNNSIVYNIFYHKEFAAIIDRIEMNFTVSSPPSSSTCSQLRQKVSKFKELPLEGYSNDETTKTTAFLEKILEQLYECNNLLFISSLSVLERKLDEVGQNIYDAMKRTIYDEGTGRLRVFDDQLEEKRYSVNILSNDFESAKLKQKEKLTKLIEEIAKKIDEYIKRIEERMNTLPMESKYDPINSFKNMMTYNVVISSLLFLVGGCSGYSTQYYQGGLPFKEMFVDLILAGIKWGLATFLIGFILSVVVAISTFASRASHKQRLQQKINWLKNQKELEVNNAKSEAEHKEKTLKESFDERIAELKLSIDSLSNERGSLEKSLRQEADLKLKEESTALLSLLTLKTE